MTVAPSSLSTRTYILSLPSHPLSISLPLSPSLSLSLFLTLSLTLLFSPSLSCIDAIFDWSQALVRISLITAITYLHFRNHPVIIGLPNPFDSTSTLDMSRRWTRRQHWSLRRTRPSPSSPRPRCGGGQSSGIWLFGHYYVVVTKRITSSNPSKVLSLYLSLSLTHTHL